MRSMLTLPPVELGTFNNNVLTMAAGRAGLEQVFTPERAKKLHERGDRVRRTLQEASRRTLMKVTGYGSIMCFHFTRVELDQIRSPSDLADNDKNLGALFHLYLLEKGYYIARRGFVALSLAVSDEDLRGFVDAARGFLESYEKLLRLEFPSSKL